MKKTKTLSSNDFDIDIDRDFEEQYEEPVKSFSKKQILESNFYKDRRDALNVLLDNGQRYSINEVNRILDEFYGGQI